MGVPLSSTVPIPTADGVYPYLIPTQPAGPPTQLLNLIAKSGTADWGPEGQPIYYSTIGQAMYIWGANATLLNAMPSGVTNSSLVGATQAMLPEGTSFVDVRVCSSSALAATGSVLDGSAGTVANFAAYYRGLDGNSIKVITTLQNNTAFNTALPLVSVTVSIKNRASWVSPNFLAGDNTGYIKATFLANLQTALNGGYGNLACPYIKYVSAGASTLHPVTTISAAFTGGNSGAAVVGADLIGVATVGATTGIYALQNVGMNEVHCVGLTDLNFAQTLGVFGQNNTCFTFMSFPSGTTTASALAQQIQYNAIHPWLSINNDFTQSNDVIDGTGAQYIDPSCKIAAITAQNPPWFSPGNKPYVGCQNLIGTIRTGTPYGTTELGQLQTAGILIINKPISRGNVYGCAHGMTSDGVTPISDTRVINYVANAVTSILGVFVEEGQTPPPAPGQVDKDITRNNARDAVTSFLTTMQSANQIAAWEQIMDGTNNTQLSVSQGYLFDKIEITTLANIRFILVGLQIGETVQITTPGNQ